MPGRLQTDSERQAQISAGCAPSRTAPFLPPRRRRRRGSLRRPRSPRAPGLPRPALCARHSPRLRGFLLRDPLDRRLLAGGSCGRARGPPPLLASFPILPPSLLSTPPGLSPCASAHLLPVRLGTPTAKATRKRQVGARQSGLDLHEPRSLQRSGSTSSECVWRGSRARPPGALSVPSPHEPKNTHAGVHVLNVGGFLHGQSQGFPGPSLKEGSLGRERGLI